MSAAANEQPAPRPARKPGKPAAPVTRANGSDHEVPTVTNAGFLKAIFGPDYRRAHVTCFAQPPDAIPEEERPRCWAGRRFGEHGPSTTQNSYFTISLFEDLIEDGKARHVRRKAQFRAGHCVVVDDVGTKVATDDPRLPAPSWKLETSPGNFQWGYMLAKPETDQLLFSGLLGAMVAKGLSVDGTDPGMKGVTRYVRLPQGRNLKTKLMPAGFECRMHEWQPERKFTIAALGERFGLSLDDMRAHGEAGHSERGREVLASEDPLLKALADLYVAPGMDGWHNVLCPWASEHSSDDTSGTAVWVGPGRYGFHCFHGHCTNRKIGNLYDWMREQGMEVPDAGAVDDFDVEGTPPPKPTERFAFTRCHTYAEGPPPAWLIKGAIPRAEIGAIYGPSGCGKTFLALDMVMSIARGVPWRGKRVTQAAVAFVCAEGSAGFRSRLKAYAAHHGVDLSAVPLFVLGDSPSLLSKGDVGDLLVQIEKLPGLGLIVYDTWAQVTAGGNENSGEDMGKATGHAMSISRATGIMTLVIGHQGKDATKGMRGWSGVRATMDVEIAIERGDRQRVATISKMREGQGEGEEFAFELVPVVVGVDADGDNVTSCTVQYTIALPKNQRSEEPRGAHQRTVMRTAESLLDLAGAANTGELIGASINQLVPPEQGKRDTRRQHVLRAIEALVAGGRLDISDGQVKVR